MKRLGLKKLAMFCALTCVLAGLIAWVTWPSAGQLNADTCSPEGSVAKLSALIHGNGFWRVQMEDIAHQRDQAENWDQKSAILKQRSEDILRNSKIDETLQAAHENAIEIYRKLDPDGTKGLLASYEAGRRADELRRQADAIEYETGMRIVSEKMRRRVPILQKYETIIGAKLQPFSGVSAPASSKQRRPGENFDQWLRRTMCDDQQGTNSRSGSADISRLPGETLDAFVRRTTCAGPPVQSPVTSPTVPISR